MRKWCDASQSELEALDLVLKDRTKYAALCQLDLQLQIMARISDTNPDAPFAHLLKHAIAWVSLASETPIYSY